MADDPRAIAVIGLACRVPGAADAAAFWQLLRDGRSGIHAFSDAELAAAGVAAADLRDPAYVKANGVLDGVDLFDAAFFGFTPLEAAITDPQHRVFLEVAWQALEDAGYDAQRFAGKIGVFAGAGPSSYLLHNLLGHRDLDSRAGAVQLSIANNKDYVPTRVSYKLGLTGPSVGINTACSSSLVAVHFACQCLLSYEADVVLAGGVGIQVPQHVGYRYHDGGIVSPDGCCRPFDVRARGTVNGSGAGVVVLRRLEEAIADGDAIRAVIRGSAVNNDGAAKVGFTAPSVGGQAEVIAAALAAAGVDPATIDYVEAHGTATPVGDPIEIAALTQAFALSTDRKAFCAIGSVKSNVGHLDEAAGVTGLIKTVMALQHREMPPTLHFEAPNPIIDFAATPFFVNGRRREWSGTDRPRRAGVSSFGIGGTNAHCVLEEAPAAAPREPDVAPQLLTLSARTPAALDAIGRNIAAHLQAHAEAPLDAVAWTLQHGRRAFARRRAIVARTAADAVARLGTPADARETRGGAKPVFLFAGQGAQYVGMACGLYESQPVFRSVFDRCAALVHVRLGIDLRALLYGTGEASGSIGVDQTLVAQPALFAVEYALVELWRSWGVAPAAAAGHSLGEYAAATVAGTFTLDAALEAVCTRARLMQRMPPGAMASVPLGEDEARRWLHGDAAIAAINGPARCVVSGSIDAIDRTRRALRDNGVESRLLRTAHAFHSSAVDAVMDEFAERLAHLELRPPSTPWISNVTGMAITDAAATDPAYWRSQLRQPVRFADCAETLLRDPDAVFLEIGPGSTLSTLLRQQRGWSADRIAAASLPAAGEQARDIEQLLDAAGRVWTAGVDIEWRALHGESAPPRVPLPTYPFERARYWIDPPDRHAADASRRAAKSADVDRWFYLPTWTRAPLPVRPAPIEPRAAVVLLDEHGLGARLAAHLRGRGHAVIETRDVRDLEESGATLMVDVSTLSGDPLPDEAAAARDVQHVFELCRTMARRDDPVSLIVVSDAIEDVTGAEPIAPRKAMIAGPLLVLPQEHAAIESRLIDVSGWTPHTLDALAASIAVDIDSGSDRFVAWRSGNRWIRSFEALPLADPGSSGPVRDGGAYLICGGLGGVGLILADYLASAHRARLALVGRSASRVEAELAARRCAASPEHGANADAGDQAAACNRWIDAALAARGGAADRGADAASHLAHDVAALCCGYVLDLIAGAGIDVSPGSTTSAAELTAALRVVPSLQPMCRYFAHALVADGFARADGHRIVFVDAASRRPATAALHAELSGRYPQFTGMFDLLSHCAAHYPAALSGDIPAIGVLYPDGQSTLLERAAAATVADAMRDASIAAVRDLLTQMARTRTGRRLRILEVGVGDGILARAVAPALQGLDVEYHATDLGRLFVAKAERAAAAAGLSCMRFGQLDISRDPSPQGYEPASYDVVLALDVMHATADVRDSSRHLCTLLAPGGTAILIETVRAPRWTDLIWGLADGWWAFADRLRTYSPLLPARDWVAVLESAGFDRVAAWPGDDATADTALIVGHRSAEPTAPARRLIAHHAADVVERLRSRGAEILLLDADVADASAIRSAVGEALRAFGRLDAVVHAAGDTRREVIVNPIESTTAEHLDAVCHARVAGTRALADAVAGAPVDSIVLISSNASVLGGLGLAAYAAAGRYLDAFAAARVRDGDRRWISTNWDGWPTEAAAGFDSRFHTSIDRYAMTMAESHDAFRRAAAQHVPQVVVSSGDFHHRLAQWIDRRVDPAPSQPPSAPSHQRRDSGAAQALPSTESERALARIWEELLGIAPIGIDDVFAELGGDSLLGTQLIARIERSFGCRVPFRSLFEEPTVRLQAARIAGLLAANRLSAGGRASVAEPAAGAAIQRSIPRLPDAAHFALSHAQRRLWVLSQLDGSAAYNIPLHQRLDGPLDVEALERALTGLVERHESLRTAIVAIDGEPRQRIEPLAAQRLPVVDVRGRRDPEGEARLIAAEHAAAPFDLSAAPLFRAGLVTVAADRSILLFTIHHIVCDGVSIAVLVRDLIELYRAAIGGDAARLPALPVQYRDYAAWQEAQLRDGALDAERDYWLRTLAAPLQPLELPADYPRPPVQSFRGRERTWHLPPAQAAAVAELARAHQASLFMLLTAVVKVLLYRYTGADDIVVGTAVAGRTRPELDDQVGCYLNMLALRDRIDGDRTFASLLADIRQTATSAYDRQAYPFDRLVDELELPRDLSRSPLFDVVVILQNQRESALQLGGLEVRDFFEHNGTSKVDMTFTFKETPLGLAIGIEYNSDLFAPSRIERTGAHLLQLLDGFVANPQQRIAAAPLGTAVEIALADAANGTARDYPGETLLDLVDAAIAASPEKIAVSCGGAQITYAGLAARTGAIAALLRRQHVRAGDRVGVHLERSIDLVPSLLAILGCGAAYVPLDPAFPVDRRRFMIEDAAVAAVVTDGAAPLPSSSVPAIDVADAAAASPLRQGVARPVAPSDLAYVIYTSGSTGVPKGVAVEHRSLANFLRSMRDELDIRPHDHWLAVTTLSFDIAGLELFLPLICGAEVAIAARVESADGIALVERMRRTRPTIMQATPATWQMLFDAGWTGDRSLTALCGGEALPWTLGRRLAGASKQAWNLYGPTETTIWSSLFDITTFVAASTTTPLAADAIVPVGRPIANTALHVLDRGGEVAPVGVPGELFIGGAGLARGYQARPEVTAERFVPDRIGRQAGARLYRTGDRAVRREDGDVEVLGRLDDQVKLRGFRIEAGEIEAALLQHPLVAQAAVVLQPPPLGPRLLAAVVARPPADGRAASALIADLRSALRGTLPEYMVPAAFAIVDALPRTANGKIDRQALRAAAAAGGAAPAHRAASTGTERRLAAIWAEILQLASLSADQNFFDLGGHSLRAARMSFLVAQAFAVRLTLADIFQHPTVEALARVVDARVAAGGDAIDDCGIPSAPLTAEELEMLDD